MPEGTGTTEGTSQTAGEAGKSTQDGTTGTGTATQNAGTTEKSFTQADVDRIVKERLASEQERQRKRNDEEDAKKRGDYEKVAATEREKAENALTRYKNRAAQAEVATLAGRLQIVDGETALALIQGKIEFDADGEPTNVEKLLAELVKTKPFLVKGSEPATSTTSTANPDGGKGGGKFDPKRPPAWGAVFRK